MAEVCSCIQSSAACTAGLAVEAEPQSALCTLVSKVTADS